MHLGSESKLSKSRRKHKNSKNGCPNCKRRRVKCSEDLPSCLNCIKHKVKCGYLDYTEDQIQELQAAKMAVSMGDDPDEFPTAVSAASGASAAPNQDSLPQLALLAQLALQDTPKVPLPAHTSPQNHANWSSTSIATAASTGGASEAFNKKLEPQITAEHPHSASMVSPMGFPPAGGTHNPSVTSFQHKPSTSSFASFLGPGQASISTSGGTSAAGLAAAPAHAFHSLISGVNSTLSLDHHEITQNFDNLLTTTSDPEHSIIYPVYHFNEDASGAHLYSPSAWQAQLAANTANTAKTVINDQYGQQQFQIPFQFQGSSISQMQQQQQLAYASKNHSQAGLPSFQQLPHYTSPTASGGIGVSVSVSASVPASVSAPTSAPGIVASYQDSLYKNSPSFRVASQPKPLAGAITSGSTFAKIEKARVNQINLLLHNIILTGPRIVQGTCPLSEIRSLYLSWINSFIYRSYDSKLMFSCLLNFGANYLISTCLESEDSSLAFASINKKKLKHKFIVISIRHYGNIIKLLREVLNLSKDPELCSLTSYILSLMSIYDPEATLHSINCFRDGLFGVLSHYLNIAKLNSRKPTILIPSHLQLMKNIVRSVYLPGFNPSFLQEFDQVLSSFGQIMTQCIGQCSQPVSANMRFINTKFNDLVNFNNDTINYYLPKINENLGDVDIQQEVLFQMVHRWVRLFASRLLVITEASNPLEKVLFLFYKTMKKSLYAILPQVKFFFLRDFDLPLMSEVFATKNDYDIYQHEIDNPANLDGISHEFYQQHVDCLKQTSAYLFRVNSFLERRLAILYRYIVYEEIVTTAFPIDDIRKWRNSITSIETARQDFVNLVGMRCEPILKFRDTVIEPKHYPTGNGNVAPEFEASSVVDFNTLQPSGLLACDYDPRATLPK